MAGRPPGALNKVKKGVEAAADEEGGTQLADAAAPDDEPDLKQLIRSLSSEFAKTSLEIKGRLGILEQNGRAATPGGSACAASVAGSTVASDDSTLLEVGALMDIVGIPDPDYRHDLDTSHLSSQWRQAIVAKKSGTAWTANDTEVLNTSSLLARTTAAAIDALSQGAADGGRFDHVLDGLYQAEAQLRRTFGRLQLRLHANDHTSEVVWRAALARQAHAENRQSWGGMQFALPAVADIMAEVNKKAAEADLKDFMASLSTVRGAASKERKAHRLDEDDRDEVLKLKAELKASKEKNGSNEQRLRYAKQTLKTNNIEWQPPPTHTQQTAGAAKGKRQDQPPKTKTKPPTGEGGDPP